VLVLPVLLVLAAKLSWQNGKAYVPKAFSYERSELASHLSGLFKQWQESLHIAFTVSQLQSTPKTEPGENLNVFAHESGEEPKNGPPNPKQWSQADQTHCNYKELGSSTLPSSSPHEAVDRDDSALLLWSRDNAKLLQ
jgi:hypothetical protein